MSISYDLSAQSLPLILASTSPYRKDVLDRLYLPFETYAPEIDESPLPDEQPVDLVIRLAELKARSAQLTYPKALIIGSDQVAVIGTKILGKPRTHEEAVKQLTDASGQQVDFLTGLCLFNTSIHKIHIDMVRFSVKFRTLNLSQIENYLSLDKPYNCSGSFKSEGLGIALLDKMEGNDPTAIIGLPLIRLVRMLEAEGVSII